MKSDLGKIKKGNPKSKAENKRGVIQNVQFFFGLIEKITVYFRGCSFLLSEAK